MADFYWDNASPAFDMPGNTGAFINRMAREYPSLHPCVEKLPGFPRISIIGVPSRVGQAKLAGEIITRLYPHTVPESASEQERDTLLRRTAVVFPDEALAIPALRSIPPYIDPVNLTMGYRLRQSAAATFVSSVVKMQLRGRATARDGAGKFLTEDVLQVLTHPIIHQGAQKAAISATLRLRLMRTFTVDAAFFMNPGLQELAPVFSFVRNSDGPRMRCCHTCIPCCNGRLKPSAHLRKPTPRHQRPTTRNSSYTTLTAHLSLRPPKPRLRLWTLP